MPQASATASMRIGSDSGDIHSAGITCSKPNTLPNSNPKAVELTPTAIATVA